MKNPIIVSISEINYKMLYEHLFPGDYDEHGAVLSVGISISKNGTRLLVRDVFLAKDGVDYVDGERGYRALNAEFVARTSDYCKENNLGYLAVHCHGGENEVSFSEDDYASHKRGYPSLLQFVGEPIGALVFAKNAVAGEIWTNDGIFKLKQMVIVGPKIRKLYPAPLKNMTTELSPVYDRHARLFGDAGQSILADLKIGIIGLGGGGSLLNEWLSRLGVGEIIAVDFDKVEPSNLPRIVGSCKWDSQYWLTKSKYKFLQKIGSRYSKYKVQVAKRVAKKANSKIKYTTIVGNILDEKVAKQLKDVDFIFLATDNIASRNVFNSLLHQYLIPGAQVGSKVIANKKSKKINDIFAVGRMILPHKYGGCLYCNGWIPPSRLQSELLSDEEKKKQNYIDNENIEEPSVITLNVLSAAHIINDFMMMFTGLYPSNLKLQHIFNDVLKRESNSMELTSENDCLHCSKHPKSNLARGDKGELPCRKSE